MTALSPVIVDSSAADQMSITQTLIFFSGEVSLLVICLFSDYIVIGRVFIRFVYRIGNFYLSLYMPNLLIINFITLIILDKIAILNMVLPLLRSSYEAISPFYVRS